MEPHAKEMLDEKMQKIDADVTPVEEDGKDDLDPVALKKAFRFASWASLALVRNDATFYYLQY